MSKVIFVIIPSCSNSNWLNRKMLQITKTFIWILAVESRYPIYVVDSYNDINKYLDKAEYIVVSTAGNVLVDIGHIRNMIELFPKDVGIMGHLLQYSNDITPWLHEQFFIINTSAVKNIDLSFNTNYDTGIELVRSKEDMHGGWAPLELSLGTQQVNRELKFGTTLIEQCLLNGYRVRNFDTEWRYPVTSNDYVSTEKRLPSRGYCYPCENTDIFERSLRELKVHSGLNEAQEMIITTLVNILNFNVLNVWNNDTVPVDIIASHVVSTSNGFLGELLALYSGAKTITFYDKNLNNLNFKKYLYKEWDGKDYDKLANEWASKNSLSVEPVFEVDKIKCQKWIDIVTNELFSDWYKWKDTVEVEFIHCDIVSNPAIIVDKIQNKTILHTSTVLSIFPFTAFVHDDEVIESVRRTISEKISQTDSSWIET